MSFDIPFAGWLLSTITFVLGTITPFIYRRFFYEGIGIQQSDIRATTQSEEELKQSRLVFSTVIKVVNAQKQTIMLDDIRFYRLKVGEFRFQPIGLRVQTIDVNGDVTLPPQKKHGQQRLDLLPVLIKPDEERFFALGFYFQYKPLGSEDAIHILAEHIERKGIGVRIRINGMYRHYRLEIKRQMSDDILLERPD